MILEDLATLGVLALVDSLSLGTLLIPVFFLIAPKLRAGRMLVYLLTIAGFYFAVGILLLAGASVLLGSFRGVMESSVGQWVQLVVGGILLAVAIAMPTKPKPVPEGEEPKPGRLARWRDHALTSPNPLAVVGIAIAAGLVELATMVPYLGAIGILSGSDLDAGGRVLLLLAYCGVMIAPALVLLVVRIVARPLVEPPLRRLAAWLERTGAENTAWILGIVGFLLLRAAASELGVLDGITGMLDRL
jgi:hypothetical protein